MTINPFPSDIPGMRCVSNKEDGTGKHAVRAVSRSKEATLGSDTGV